MVRLRSPPTEWKLGERCLIFETEGNILPAMERSRFEEGQKSKLLAFVNYEMGKAFVGWKTGRDLQENTERLSAIVFLAQKAGAGFAITVKEGAIYGEHASSFTGEARKHLKQDEYNDLVFTIPDADERRTLHNRVLKIEIDDKYLRLNSIKGMEATFNRTDVLFLKAR